MTALSNSGRVLVALGLFALVWAPFAQVAGFDFVVCDDPTYIYENPTVLRGLTGEGLRWAFFGAHAANWHPLTWLSHMLDCELFAGSTEQWAGGHHLINVFLHGLTTVAAFLALSALTRRWGISAFTAALFAVHPLHVESVAWVAERKDVLSGLFWMLGLWAYAGYARRRSSARYLAVTICLLLGAMAKPMVVTLPFVFLLLDGWPLNRIGPGPHRLARLRALIIEKLPWFLIVAALAWITLVSQSAGGAMRSESGLPVPVRVANALVSYGAYLMQTVWPTDLAIFYPHPYLVDEERWSAAFVLSAALSAVLLGALSLLAVRSCRSRPYLLFGWLYYVGTLVPVIGLVQVGGQARADRYTYLPLLGIFLAVAASLAPLVASQGRRRTWALALTLAALLAALSARQTSYWRDDLRLFGHAIDVVPANFLAYNHLGLALYRRGKVAEAVDAFDAALAIRANDEWVLNNRAVCAMTQRDIERAETLLRRALELDPNFADAWSNLGNVKWQQHDFDAAARCYQRAMESARSERIEYPFNLALACERLERLDEALRWYAVVLNADPQNLRAAGRTGSILAEQGRTREARALLDRVLTAAPHHAEALLGLGIADRNENQLTRAEARLRDAIAADPQLGSAHRELASLLAARGDWAGAVFGLEAGLAIDPLDPDVLNDLGVGLAQLGRIGEARTRLEAAVRSRPADKRARENLDRLGSGGIPSRLSRAR